MGFEWKKIFDINEPPEYLYYVNGDEFKEYTMKNGLVSNGGHLSMMRADIDETMQIGAATWDRPIIYTVHSGAMYRQGFIFYKSENGVWLTERVPVEYLTWRA